MAEPARPSPFAPNYPVSALLVDPEFRDATGDLNARAIGAMARCLAMARLQVGRLGPSDPPPMQGPDLASNLVDAIELVQRLSPSKEGRGRDDIVEMNKQRTDPLRPAESLTRPAAPR